MLFESLIIGCCMLALAAGRTQQEKEEEQKAIKMKTTRQLKEIFDEVGVSHKGLSKEDLKKKAYKEGVMLEYWKLHPEKRYKAPKGDSSTGGMPGGMPDMGGDFGPGGKYEDMMRQMRGDFGGEKDPERRRILEKLAKKGMSFAGGSGQSTEELLKMEKMMDGINLGGFGGGGGGGFGGGGDEGDLRDSSEMDGDDLADEDKMEL